jgi:hypothetical protein
LRRIRHASVVRSILHTSWLLGVVSRARLQLLLILLALRLNYTLNLISISQQVRLTIADKRTLAWQADDKTARHPAGEKCKLRIWKEYGVKSIFIYLFHFWTFMGRIFGKKQYMKEILCLLRTPKIHFHINKRRPIEPPSLHVGLYITHISTCSLKSALILSSYIHLSLPIDFLRLRCP